MNAPRGFLLATVLASLLLLSATPTALADVEVSRSGDVVTVQGSIFGDELLLGAEGTTFRIESTNIQQIDAGAGCTNTSLQGGNCGTASRP